MGIRASVWGLLPHPFLHHPTTPPTRLQLVLSLLSWHDELCHLLKKKTSTVKWTTPPTKKTKFSPLRSVSFTMTLNPLSTIPFMSTTPPTFAPRIPGPTSDSSSPHTSNTPLTIRWSLGVPGDDMKRAPLRFSWQKGWLVTSR